MKYKTYIIILLLALIGCKAHAQESTLRGTVTDSILTPICWGSITHTYQCILHDSSYLGYKYPLFIDTHKLF